VSDVFRLKRPPTDPATHDVFVYEVKRAYRVTLKAASDEAARSEALVMVEAGKAPVDEEDKTRFVAIGYAELAGVNSWITHSLTDERRACRLGEGG